MKDLNVCIVEECEKPVDRPKQGLCEAHYTRLRRYGSVHGKATKRQYQNPECSISGCNLKPYARNLCQKHYTRLLRNGSPTAGQTGRGEVIGWLMDHVSYDFDECLIWPYSRSDRGYGLVTYNGRQRPASRVMCILAHGKPKNEDMQAAHNCGNGHNGCVNPKHLRWATIFENHADKLIHGTHLCGEYHPMSKLSDDDVRDIRSSEGKVSAYNLSDKYGVSSSMIYIIWRRKAWTHI